MKAWIITMCLLLGVGVLGSLHQLYKREVAQRTLSAVATGTIINTLFILWAIWILIGGCSGATPR